VLTASFYFLTLAAVAGTILGLLHLRGADGAARPPLMVGMVHGAIGAVGLALLLPVAFGPPRAAAAGAALFGPLAAWLFGVALLTGAIVLIRRRRGPYVTMAIHAGIAITAYVILLAWYLLGCALSHCE